MLSWAVVAQAFNPSTWKVARDIQRNFVSGKTTTTTTTTTTKKQRERERKKKIHV